MRRTLSVGMSNECHQILFSSIYFTVPFDDFSSGSLAVRQLLPVSVSLTYQSVTVDALLCGE